MSIIDELRKLKPREFALAIIAFLSTVAPGCLILYWFRPAILEDYDVIKVCMLSLALTLPVLCVNIALIAVPPLERYKTVASHFDALLGGALASFLALYPSLLLAYVFGYGFKCFVFVTVFTDIVALCVMIPTIHDDKTDHPSENKKE